MQTHLSKDSWPCGKTVLQKVMFSLPRGTVSIKPGKKGKVCLF